MNRKELLIVLSKIFISGIFAFIILTGFCCFYYNTPVHYASPEGETDHRWEPNAVYSRWTEGFGWGKTNNDGYTNLFDYRDQMKIDVLIMGSSHMEALQIAESKSAASRLNELLPNDLVYNIGISSHNFTTCVCNLEAALEKYQPSKYVVIDTWRVDFSEDDILKMIHGEVEEIKSYTGGILGLLQRNQYLRLMYSQLGNWMKMLNKPTQGKDVLDAAENDSQINNGIFVRELLSKLSLTVEKKGIKLVILYHPFITIDENGAMKILEEPFATMQFSQLCQEYGIIFLDMSERFLQEYEESYILPYGFVNTKVGEGHLNQYGHAMIADELYKLIGEEE